MDARGAVGLADASTTTDSASSAGFRPTVGPYHLLQRLGERHG
jgi:hypothetical protein